MKNILEIRQIIAAAPAGTGEFVPGTVLAGDWCYRDGQSQVKGVPVIPYSWEDREALRAGREYTDAIYEAVLDQVVPWLNRVHGLRRETRYWRMIIGYFLLTYVQILYDRYRSLVATAVGYPLGELAGLHPGAYTTCADGNEFICRAVGDDALNLQLFTQLAPFVPMCVRVNGFKVQPLSPVPRKPKMAGLRLLLSRFWFRAAKGRVVFYSTLADRSVVRRLVVRSLFRVVPMTGAHRVRRQQLLDFSTRDTLATLRGSDGFSTAIFQTLVQNLPFAYLEGFAKLQMEAATSAQRYLPRAIVSAVGLYLDPFFAIWAGECVTRGARLIAVQHGGLYGETRPHNPECYERSISDLFVSWGWDNGAGVVPMPAPRLMGIEPSSRRGRRDRVLWVTTEDSRYTPHLSPVPMGPQLADYFAAEEKFYGSLESKVRPHILIRLYPKDFGWDRRARWGSLYPELAIDDGVTPIRTLLREAKIAVIDYFGSTVLLEALAMRIPVLVFGNPERFRVCEAAVPYYELLRAAGVLHDNPDSAAATLNSIYPDVDRWWSEQHRQEAVRIFSEHFARTAPDAIAQWVAFARKL